MLFLDESRSPAETRREEQARLAGLDVKDRFPAFDGFAMRRTIVDSRTTVRALQPAECPRAGRRVGVVGQIRRLQVPLLAPVRPVGGTPDTGP